jgi:CDP-diacylglycerol pyrophosphatase
MSERRLFRAVALTGTALLLCGAGALAASLLPRDALRTTVNLCVAVMARTQVPLPCSQLTWHSGYEVAILNPPVPGKHRLVVPALPVVGLEDDVLRGPAGAAYFSAAWQTALARAGGRWDGAGLAVNSARVRTQDQLHFHADCLNAFGRSSLNELSAGPAWERRGRAWIRLVPGTTDLNPFALLRQIPEFSRDLRKVNFGIFGVGTAQTAWFLLADTSQRSYERFLTSACPN